MSRGCSVCAHRSRQDIDRALIEGRSAREIAASFGLNYQSVNRHRLNHLPAAIRRAAREALERADTTTERPLEAHRAQNRPEADCTAAAPPVPSPAVLEAIGEDLPTSAPARMRRRGIALNDDAPGATVAPIPTLATPSTRAAGGSAQPVLASPAESVFNGYQEAVALRARALAILEQAERDGDLKTALTAIREARGVLDHLARLEERQGNSGQAVPLAQAPEWHRTRTAIIAALAEFPEARLAVAEALAGAGAFQ